MRIERVFLENALITAHEYARDRVFIIEKYLEYNGVDEEIELEHAFAQLSDKQIKELFQKVFE